MKKKILSIALTIVFLLSLLALAGEPDESVTLGIFIAVKGISLIICIASFFAMVAVDGSKE